MASPFDERSIEGIRSYHAHVYYDASSKAAATKLSEAVGARFDVKLGRFHDRPIGPHPMGSRQIAFEPALFGRLVPWLALNRGDLTIFVHAESGDAMTDHTRHVFWLGESQPLNLDALR
jgi:aromatic ring-cleaving dioxygenase